MPELVVSSFSEGVGRITLNRPDKRNALKRDFIVELHEAISKMVEEPNLRVLVFAAEGSVFCAGMDLGEMQERAESENGKSEWQKDSEVYFQLLSRVHSMDVPTIVALQGPVLAGGVGLVLACDFIVASDNAYFMLPEPMRGITAAMVTPLLTYRIGAGLAGHLLLSNEKMTAARAKEVGLCYDVVDAEGLGARVDALVGSILTGSRSALQITKQHLGRCSNENLIAQVEQSVKVSAEARETADAREGLAAFLEKRKPNWN